MCHFNSAYRLYMPALTVVATVILGYLLSLENAIGVSLHEETMPTVGIYLPIVANQSVDSTTSDDFESSLVEVITTTESLQEQTDIEDFDAEQPDEIDFEELLPYQSEQAASSAVNAQATNFGQFIGTYNINYRYNAGGCLPPSWPNPGPTDGNPYSCSSGIAPGPYFIDAKPGKYRVVVNATSNVKSAHVWTGDANSGLRYSLELPVGSIVEFDHTHGQIVLYAWDWFADDNDSSSWTEVALYGEGSGLSITADRASVWANGHEESRLTARLLDNNGQPVVGQEIKIQTAPSSGVKIKPKKAATNAQGEAVFVATSTETGNVTFTASTKQNPAISSTAQVEFQRHKVVVLFLGIRTKLDCNSISGVCTPNDPTPWDDSFLTIRGLLAAQGFKSADFVWYSYQGGRVDSTTGEWKANSYLCTDTQRNFRATISQMWKLLDSFGKKNPNTDFYLVGHSQGGLIAFQSLGFVNRLPPTTRLAGVITLDSPLGGVPFAYEELLRPSGCWGNPAAGQLYDLYGTVTGDVAHQTSQGAVARMLCSLSGINLCAPQQNLQAAVNAESLGVQVHTYGNLDDGVFNASNCILDRPAYFPDNSTSQVIMISELKSLGGDASLNPVTCISESHRQVFIALSADVVANIGPQINHP